MSASVLQLHHRESFERVVGRALVAGAASGALHLAVSAVGHAPPLWYLALAATCLAAVAGDAVDRAMLFGLGVVLPAAPLLLGMTPGWTVATAGAATGAVLVRAQACARGDEGPGIRRAGALSYALGAAATGLLALAGAQVAQTLSARLAFFSAPALVAAAVAGASIALFAALGVLPAHLVLRADPIEARAEELLPTLGGDFRALAARALALYRQCGAALASLPRDAAQEELASTLAEMTRGALELSGEWSGVEKALEGRARAELEEEIASLEKGAKEARDPVAGRQLASAARALGEELARVDALSLRRERILARLRAQVASLESARVALIGLRSGHAQVHAAELASVARRVSALARAQSEEASAADEAATGAALAEVEVEARVHSIRERAS